MVSLKKKELFYSYTDQRQVFHHDTLLLAYNSLEICYTKYNDKHYYIGNLKGDEIYFSKNKFKNLDFDDLIKFFK